MYRPQDDKVHNQKLKVQEITVRFSDKHLYVVSGSDVILLIKEPLQAAASCLFQDDSAGTIAPIAASALSIVDSAAYTAGGDKKAIKVASVTLAASDVLHVKYIAE